MLKNRNIIFGIRPILEAVNSGKDIDKVLIQRSTNNPLIKELHLALKNASVPFQYVLPDKLKAWNSKNHQGVVAFLSEITYYNIEDVIQQVYEKGDDPFVLVLDHITDVRNFGALARTAECAGVHALVIPEKGAASINADAIKSSAGALLKIPVCRSKNLVNTIKSLKDNGLQIISASEKAENHYYQLNYKIPSALVMGSEDTGISEPLLQLSDQIVSIPLAGTIQSLNVSVATGIILFERLKQKVIKK
ncbi:MAG: 23S rRNA (guanosine(2251)-2'-O)-methyltransferase RlmB [Bacteroidales bacterium]